MPPELGQSGGDRGVAQTALPWSCYAAAMASQAVAVCLYCASQAVAVPWSCCSHGQPDCCCALVLCSAAMASQVIIAVPWFYSVLQPWPACPEQPEDKDTVFAGWHDRLALLMAWEPQKELWSSCPALPGWHSSGMWDVLTAGPCGEPR